MRPSKKWFQIGLLAGSVAVTVAFGVFSLVTEHQRVAAIGLVSKPEVLIFHEKLIAAADRDDSNIEQDLKDALDTIARYETLFARVKEASHWGWQGSWETLCEKNEHTSLREWPAEDRAAAESLLEAHQDLVREIRELVGQGGPMRVLRFREGDTDANGVFYLGGVRECTRILRADAVVRAANGDHARAVEDITGIISLSALLAEEPVLLSQVNRWAVEGLLVESFERSFGYGQPGPDLADRLVRRLSEYHTRETFSDAWQGEGVIARDRFASVRERGWAAAQAWWGWRESPFPLPILVCFGGWLYSSPLGRPWQNMDERTYYEFTSRIVPIARLPFYEGKPLLDELDQDIRGIPITRVHSKLSFDGFYQGAHVSLAYMKFTGQARYEAMIDIMRIGILIEQYHVQTGVLPDTLDAIAPGLGRTVPVDPFTGEPYHYKPQGGTFLLYSVGDNLIDDGGKHDYSEGDIVWRGEWGDHT